MFLRLFSGLALIGTSVAHPTWEEFKATYGKYYNGDEEQRRSVYQANLQIIDAHNSKGLSSRLGVNQLADLTAEEYRLTYLPGLTAAPQGAEEALFDAAAAMPERVDWREAGAVTPVKDQGSCGSCWAFSATGAVEGAWLLARGELLELSEEELMDCSKDGNKGCRGGEPLTALQFVRDSGLCTEDAYPYTTLDFECLIAWPHTPCKAAAHIDGYKTIQRYNEAALKAAVAQQPVSVAIDASGDVFHLYESGVISADDCTALLDHAVLAVGYGTENGQDYWLIKNSWNVTWGDEGYVKLARTDSTATYGTCGIAQQAVYPVVNVEPAQV